MREQLQKELVTGLYFMQVYYMEMKSYKVKVRVIFLQ